MKLREVIDEEGRYENLVIDFYNKLKTNNPRESDKAQAMLVTSLLTNGWTDPYIKKILNSIHMAGSEADVMKVITRINMDLKEALLYETNEMVTYKLKLTIPAIKKDDLRYAMNKLMTTLKNGKIKVVKKKLLPTVGIDLGSGGNEADEEGSEEQWMNIPVLLKIRTKLDRRRILKTLGSDYKIDDLSYTKNDR